MSEWFETLDGLKAQAWAQLGNAAEARSLVSLATVSTGGDPEVRTVVLRGADPADSVLEVYTDLQSDKIAALRANARASILHWNEADQLQVRATCSVTILTGDAVMDRWRAIPDHSRLSYGMTPAPGQVIPDSTAYVKEPDPAVFAVLSCEVTHIDVVHLGKPHRRAAFTRLIGSQGGEWSSNWLAP